MDANLPAGAAVPEMARTAIAMPLSEETRHAPGDAASSASPAAAALPPSSKTVPVKAAPEKPSSRRAHTVAEALRVHSVVPDINTPMQAFGASVAGSVALELRSADTRAKTSAGKLPHEKTHEDWIEEALRRVGYGRYQHRLFALCSLGWANDALWWTGISFMMPGITAAFNLSPSMTGLMLTLFYFGSALGEIIWGAFAAYYGRRLTFGVTLGLCGFSGILMALMPAFGGVCVFATLLGMSYGGNVALDSCLFLEWIPKEMGSVMSYMNMIFWCGSVVPSLLAWAIMPLELTLFDHPAYVGTSSWRVFTLILAGINLVMLACRRLLLPLYETPYFSATKDDWEGASRDLRRVAEYNRDPLGEKEEFAFEEHFGVGAGREPRNRVVVEKGVDNRNWFTKVLDGVKFAVASVRDTWNAAVANDPLLRTTSILLFIFWFVYYLGGVSFSSFLAVLLTNMGLTNESATYRDLVIYTVAAIPSAVVCRYMLDWPPLGRVGTIWTATLFMAASLAGFGAVAFEAAKNDPSQHAALEAGSLATSVLFNVGWQISSTALWLYTPELYPTAHRTQLLGLAMSLGRFSSMLAPTMSGALLSADVWYRNALLPFVSAGILVFAAGICFALPLETLPEAAKLGLSRGVARSVTELEAGHGAGTSAGEMVDVPLGSDASLVNGHGEPR
ncbi:major facilitator superfamily domain-containing protein [Hyaloraphidium curvatum]|nr:major facilitator superfamily domain-containing protein [Hyaloraphidium curvatum]